MEAISISSAGIILLTIFGLDAGTFVAIVGGIVIPALSFFGGAIWWFHKRIRNLEDADEDREAVVYGGDNNPLNIGLVKEVKSLKEDFETAADDRRELREQQREIIERLDGIEKKIDEYNGKDDD